jgi:hypothetical protein
MYRGKDLFMLVDLPAFPKEESILSWQFKYSSTNRAHLEIFEENKIEPIQTLYFPKEISYWESTKDGKTLLVAPDNMLFCWVYKEEHKQFTLAWDNGDALVCNNLVLDNVKGLSPQNKQLLIQYGAKEPATADSASTSHVETSPQKDIMIKTAPPIQSEAEALDQRLIAFKAEKKTMKKALRAKKEALRVEKALLKQKLLTYHIVPGINVSTIPSLIFSQPEQKTGTLSLEELLRHEHAVLTPENVVHIAFREKTSVRQFEEVLSQKEVQPMASEKEKYRFTLSREIFDKLMGDEQAYEKPFKKQPKQPV